jgi:CBS domain-containing protein
LTGLSDVDATKLLHPVGRIGMSKSIGDIIGKYREKYSVDTDLPLREVIGFMHDKNIGAVAVCEGDKVVGVFSERDLLRRVVYKRLDLDRVQLRDVMSSPAYWISIDERYEVAKAIMIDKGLRQVERRVLPASVSALDSVTRQLHARVRSHTGARGTGSQLTP